MLSRLGILRKSDIAMALTAAAMLAFAGVAYIARTNPANSTKVTVIYFSWGIPSSVFECSSDGDCMVGRFEGDSKVRRKRFRIPRHIASDVCRQSAERVYEYQRSKQLPMMVADRGEHVRIDSWFSTTSINPSGGGGFVSHAVSIRDEPLNKLETESVTENITEAERRLIEYGR